MATLIMTAETVLHSVTFPAKNWDITYLAVLLHLKILQIDFLYKHLLVLDMIWQQKYK